MAKRSKVPYLMVADLNFGIRKEDYFTALYINRLTKEHGWPKIVDLTAAKNNKGCISDIVELLGDSYLMGASVQSTSESVLSKIKRKNLPLSAIVTMAKKSARFGGNSFSEIILCLPGDSKDTYTKSLFDLLDAGINEVRSYQFIMLDGTEGASAKTRAEYQYFNKWRVLPRCYGIYDFRGEKFQAAEFHEVCIGNSTMPHEDYLACRKFGLIIEVFNNGKVFGELLDFLNDRGIRRSLIMNRLLSVGLNDKGTIGKLLTDFTNDENENFFDTKEEIEEFLARPSSIDRYISGELGKNQMLYYRAKALLEHLEDCSKVIFLVARESLAEQGKLDRMTDLYLTNLEQYIFACRGNIFSEAGFSKRFDFDFVELKKANFSVDPMDYHKTDGLVIAFGHGEDEQKELNAMLSQFGKNISGLGHLMQRANIVRYYRDVSYPHR